MVSLVAGVALLGGFVAAYFAGATRFVTPGDVATDHAPIDFQCAQCHAPRSGVVDLRCERCHDPAGSERLMNAAHVLFGSGDSVKADRAEIVACMQCHTDHRGRAFRLRAVDDRECGRCHQFRSLADHPEFAVVKAQITTGLGLGQKFKHEVHIVKVQQQLGKGCDGCHVPTTDQRTFEPIAFDRHCAQCHTTGGYIGKGRPDTSGPVMLALLAPNAAQMTESCLPAQAPCARTLDAEAGLVEVTNVRHRDPWMLANALWLRRGIDPFGESAERGAVRAQVAWLEQQLQIDALPSVPGSTLTAWAAALEREIADIDADRARTRSRDDTRALEEIRRAVIALAGALGAAEGSLIEPLKPLTAAGPPPPPSTAASAGDPEAARGRFDARRAAVLQLVAAIRKRDPRLADRATALEQRVRQLAPPGTDEPPDSAALLDGLAALDDTFRSVRATSDAAGALEAARIGELRRLAAQRVGGGLSPEDFDQRRRELVSALDAVAARGDQTLQIRAAALRQRVLALRPGTTGDTDLPRLRRQKGRLLQRIRLELELGAANPQAPVVVGAPLRDRNLIQLKLDRARKDLASMEGGPRPGAPLTEAERKERAETLDQLLVPCLACHTLSGTRLEPTTLAQPVMPRSIFTHAPHVQQGQASCDTCHPSIWKSQAATDVNVPGVAKCQTCHKPSQTRSDCATCHIYHPRSAAELLTPL